MRPLRKGAARTGLQRGLEELALSRSISTTEESLLTRVSRLQAAVLGGALKQTCDDMKIDVEVFFRYTNENIWRLTRALGASNLLDQADK